MFTIKNVIKFIELFKQPFYSFKIKKLNQKIEKCEIKLKNIKLKISLNLFYADKIFHEAKKPFTYFTKVKLSSNFKQFDKLMIKKDKRWIEIKALYLKLEFYEYNK